LDTTFGLSFLEYDVRTTWFTAALITQLFSSRMVSSRVRPSHFSCIPDLSLSTHVWLIRCSFNFLQRASVMQRAKHGSVSAGRQTCSSPEGSLCASYIITLRCN